MVCQAPLCFFVCSETRPQHQLVYSFTWTLCSKAIFFTTHYSPDILCHTANIWGLSEHVRVFTTGMVHFSQSAQSHWPLTDQWQLPQFSGYSISIHYQEHTLCHLLDMFCLASAGSLLQQRWLCGRMSLWCWVVFCSMIFWTNSGRKQSKQAWLCSTEAQCLRHDQQTQTERGVLSKFAATCRFDICQTHGVWSWECVFLLNHVIIIVGPCIWVCVWEV